MTWRSCPLLLVQTGLISLFKGQEKSLHHVALVAMTTYDFPAHDYTQMAVPVKKDCCDPEILLPW